MAGRTVVTVLGLALALSHCSDEPSQPAPEVAVSMTQPIPFRDTPKVLLRVDNLGHEPLHITEAGLDWSAYGGRTVIPKDIDLQPGERIDLTFTLPPEDCAGADGDPEVVLVTDSGSVSQALRVYGEEFIRDLWATRCFSSQLRAAADISYADDWRVEPSRVSGDLLVRRRAGDEPISFRRALGSVLYRLELVRPTEVEPGARTGRVPYVVLPNNRCDEHAIGQATAPFSFKYDIELGEAEDLVVLTPPVELQDRIARMLLDHCRREGGIRISSRGAARPRGRTA